MKRLLTMFAAIAMASVAWGQPFAQESGMYQHIPKSDARTVGTRSGSLVWWSNHDSEDWGYTYTWYTGHYSVATFIPLNLVGGSEATIGGFSFFPISIDMTNVKVWISTSLPSQGGGGDLESKSVSCTLGEFNDVIFDKEYAIPQEGLYVGYSFDISSFSDDYSYRPVRQSKNENDRDGAFWMYSSENPKWVKMGGNLLAKVAFGSDGLYYDHVNVKELGTFFPPINGSVVVPVKLVNDGANDISDIDYTITIDNESSEIHRSIDLPAFSEGSFNLTFDGATTVNESHIKVEITKVNGVANTSSQDVASGAVITMDPATTPKAVPVMEEFTGTWCGWCPRGAVALKLINETYGDDVITIAAHYDDAMAIPQYKFQSTLIVGYPSATINRGPDIDPYYNRYDLNKALDAMVPGEVKVSVVWTDDSKTALKIKSEATCAYTSSYSPITVGFVLVADGLKGWSQSNYYAGESETDPNLQPLTSLPRSITDMEYDHVAVDGWGIQYGLEGSVSSSVVAGVPQKFSYVADVSSNTLIQDKSKLSVVALLVDKFSGKIYNAAKTTIGEPESSTVPVEISSAKQLAYCSDKNLDFTDLSDLKAYVATGYDKAKGTIWLTRVKQVPAQTGFLLMGEPGDYDIPTIDGVSDVYYKNMFKGTLTGTTIYTTDGDYTNYYLSSGASGVGFYKVTNENGVSIKANRCYLPILTDIPANGAEGDVEVIKVSAAKQVPYYTSKNIDFTSLDAQGVKAYTATGYNYTSGVIWLTRVKKVPAQTGILVMADKEGEYSVPTTSVQSVYENMFTGSETAQTIYTSETVGDITYINYYLSNGASGIGFYKVTNEAGVKMGANRSYLQIPKRDTAAGARGMDGNASFSKMVISDNDDDVIAVPLFTGDAIGISDIQQRVGEQAVYYNLQGLRVDKPGKGVFIRNGKKVVIK